MRTLQIPRLREELTLASDWEFDLHLESRNASLIELLEGRSLGWQDLYSQEWNPRKGEYEPTELGQLYPRRFLIPRGTRLRVERVYIRKGDEKYDSLTFKVMDSPDETLRDAKHGNTKGPRFWAKVDDVNRMEVE